MQRSESRGGSAPRFESRSIQRPETRPDRRDDSRGIIRRDDARRNETRSYDTRNDTRDNTRNDTRNWRGDVRRDDTRGDNRYDSRRDNRNDSRRDNRYDSRRGDWNPGSRIGPSRGQRYSSYGRVTHYQRHRNGYRVWIGGGLYPIFVPYSYWYRHPLSVGLFVRFGGYWDPLGYWSVYDYSPYDRYGYDNNRYDNRYDDAYTSGEIRGVVESVDLRRGTLVINDDISRQFVTVTLPRDGRVDSIREGDYVEFSGDWSRRGVFNAYRLERLDEGRY